jgi:hypothetical protein
VDDCGRNDRLEGAILGVSAAISQISNAPGLDGVVNILSFLGGIRQIGVNSSYTRDRQWKEKDVLGNQLFFKYKRMEFWRPKKWNF